jgi:hypothetical protein
MNVNSHWGGVKIQPLKISLVLAPPGSRNFTVRVPPGSGFAYFPEFKIIKTSLKGTILKNLSTYCISRR